MGLSSASMAATDNQFSSSSSLVQVVFIDRRVGRHLLGSSVFVGGLSRAAGAPVGASLWGIAPDSVGPTTPLFDAPSGPIACGRHKVGLRPGMRCVEVDDVAKADLAVVERIPARL